MVPHRTVGLCEDGNDLQISDTTDSTVAVPGTLSESQSESFTLIHFTRLIIKDTHDSKLRREGHCVRTWSLSRMCMPVGPCLYTWLIVPRGRLHTHAILRISSAAVRSSRYRA